MVDDIKKQMHRFESLIGFEGQLDITSKESVKGLIDALESKYKQDVHQAVRLHRLEFFNSLVEQDIAAGTRSLRPEHKDIDDWKDLMILSRIYYVLEHPRSDGLVWKGKAAPKKGFSDKDLVEWEVAQKFRLRRLEEWFQRRKDARSLGKEMQLEDLIGESFGKENEDRKELAELYRMFDTTSGEVKMTDEQPASRADKPFKFEDESMKDWTESYSEDSEYSDVGEFPEEFDFPDEAPREIRPLEKPIKRSEELAEKQDMMISVFKLPLPTFSLHREKIFKDMDEAETFEEWFSMYNQSFALPVEQPGDEEPPPRDLMTTMYTIAEEEGSEDGEKSTEQNASPDETTAKDENIETSTSDPGDIEELSDKEENEDAGVPLDMDEADTSDEWFSSNYSKNKDIEKPKESEENQN